LSLARSPRSFKELLDAGNQSGRDFRIITGNLEQVTRCLVVAPHGGGIEPGTSEITCATASISGRAFYIFEGIRTRGNRQLHIDSTGFDEPTFLELATRCDFILSVHGANGNEESMIYVGGLYKEGKALLIDCLNAGLRAVGIAAVDATHHTGGDGIAGLSTQNLTNRGRRRQGVQLEFSEAARRALFPDLDSRAGREHHSQHLPVLAASIERAIAELAVP
jgi:phage replication-related protein YjqB (UPF0714/DUF867 family)